MARISATVAMVVLIIVGLTWRGAGGSSAPPAADPATVAGRFGVALVEGRPLGRWATPALVAELGRPGAGRSGYVRPALLRHVVADDAGIDHAGFAVSIEAQGAVHTIEVNVVRTSGGWRVAAVEL